MSHIFQDQSTKFFDVELISPSSLSYKRNNQRYKKIRDKERKNKPYDYFAVNYNQALRKWEFVVQSILSFITNENKNRILKYRDPQSNIKFREIDFIAENKVNGLVLCELKLKEVFKLGMSARESGWRQLRKSLSVAQEKFDKLSAISICVDMSAVYGGETLAADDNYCQIEDIKRLISLPLQTQKTVWLSSVEISNVALEYGLLSQADIEYMKKAHQAYKNPLSCLNNEIDHVNHNPFQQLASIFDMNANKNTLLTFH